MIWFMIGWGAGILTVLAVLAVWLWLDARREYRRRHVDWRGI